MENSNFFFLIHVGCPGQLTRTTTIPHGPLDILQAQEQLRHRRDDRRVHRGSNPGGGAEQVHDGPQQLDPQVLGTQQSSNQGTQAGQSLPRPLSYKPRVWKTAILISPLPSTTLNIKNPQPFPFYVLSETKKRAKSLNIQIPLPKSGFFS